MAGNSVKMEIKTETVPSVELACHECAFEFDTLESAKAHFEEVHSKPKVTQRVVEAKMAKGYGFLHKCYKSGCTAEFHYIPDALSHLREVHGESPPDLVSFNRCGQLFPTMKQLMDHKDTIHRLKCHVCGMIFGSPGQNKRGFKAARRQLEAHLKKHQKETGEKCIFKCFCHLKFFSKEELQNHSAVHNHTCDVPQCGLVFRTRHKLSQHLKATHNRNY